jgi:hypothetical protein
MLTSWCAGGIELMNLVEASKYEAKWKTDRISKNDHVLSAKDPTKKGVVIKDDGTEDHKLYTVRWNDGKDDGESFTFMGVKPEDIVRMPQFNVDPKVQEYLKKGQISQVVSGGQVCVCVCTYAHVYIMRMRLLHLHACTNACGYVCVYVCVCMCVVCVICECLRDIL